MASDVRPKALSNILVPFERTSGAAISVGGVEETQEVELYLIGRAASHGSSVT